MSFLHTQWTREENPKSVSRFPLDPARASLEVGTAARASDGPGAMKREATLTSLAPLSLDARFRRKATARYDARNNGNLIALGGRLGVVIAFLQKWSGALTSCVRISKEPAVPT
jgi:hypothetical protein